MTDYNNINFEDLYSRIGYTFKDKKLLTIALTHPSYANENNLSKIMHYQRFEFLGDSIVQLIVSEYLFNEYLELLEGELTKHRAALVCEKSLALSAKKIGLDKYILVGKGEEKEHTSQKDSILCDVFEAVVCAIYLDSKLEYELTKAKDFIYKNLIFENNFDDLDYKTIIQEFFKDKSYELNYQLLQEEGPSHNKIFTVGLFFEKGLIGKGIAKSKKKAEQLAAKEYFLNNETEIRNVLKIY